MLQVGSLCKESFLLLLSVVTSRPKHVCLLFGQLLNNIVDPLTVNAHSIRSSSKSTTSK